LKEPVAGDDEAERACRVLDGCGEDVGNAAVIVRNADIGA
jgi:hypothetical protein